MVRNEIEFLLTNRPLLENKFKKQIWICRDLEECFDAAFSMVVADWTKSQPNWGEKTAEGKYKYAVAALHNQGIKLLRKCDTCKFANNCPVEELLESYEDNQYRSIYERVERKDLIDKTRQNTSPQEFEILRLTEVEGYNSKEVSEKIGISDNAARVKKKRAIERLRKFFGISDNR